MSTVLEVEDVQTTKGEKLLAVVLTVFLLIGGVWVYQEIDDRVRKSTPPDFSYRGTPEQQAAVKQLRDAERRFARAQRASAGARDDLELKREAYRTALDADRPAAQLERAYNRAQRRLNSARREAAAAGRAVVEAEPAAFAAQEEIAEVQQGRQEKRELLASSFASRSCSRAWHSATGSSHACGAAAPATTRSGSPSSRTRRSSRS